MLKKLMSLAVISMLMVGCTETNDSFKQGIEDAISNTKQEQKVQTKKEQQVKTKKKQNDNIDPETGLAKVKDGTHLQEEAAKQDAQLTCVECGQPINNCICDGDEYTNSNLKDVPKHQCSNCGDYYREGAEHTCTTQYTDYQGNIVVETWKNGQLVDTTIIYNNYSEPDEFKDDYEETGEFNDN